MVINKLKIKNNKGFSLIELIVSLGLFTVVMMISTGAMLALSDTSKKAQSMRVAFDNLNLALESMSREIRMGTQYHCDVSVGVVTSARDCVSGSSSISFLSQNGEQITYSLNSGTIEREKGFVFQDLTAPEINITNLKFYVFDTLDLNKQPRVIISIKGTAGTHISSDFNIQTTITSRILK